MPQHPAWWDSHGPSPGPGKVFPSSRRDHPSLHPCAPQPASLAAVAQLRTRASRRAEDENSFYVKCIMQLGLPAPTSPRGLFLFCVRDESPDRSVWELRVTGSPSLPSPFLCSFLPASPHPLVSVSSSLYRCLAGWLSLLASLLLYLPFQPPLISGFFSWPAIFCQCLPPSHLPHLDMPSLVLLFPSFASSRS